MAQLHLQYLFQDKPCHPDDEIADYDSLDLMSHGCHLYGEILWPDGSFTSPCPCVVLFHGFPGSARNDDLAHALCRIGCVVLTPHHRGAWGSEGKYLISNCIEDAITIAEHVRSEAFCRKYHTDPEAVFLVGHSMGANTVIHAARKLPWLKGIVLLTPFDPIRLLQTHEEQQLKDLLKQGAILHCDGPDVLFQDILAHQAYLGFENAFEALKDQNVLCATGSKDLCAPAETMFVPLWRKLQAHETGAIQHFVEYPAGHGLLGCRTKLIRDAARFLSDVLDASACVKVL